MKRHSDKSMPREDEIRLAMGEMTADQMRTAKAAIRWILNRSAPSARRDTPKLDRDWWRAQGIEACMDRMELMAVQSAAYHAETQAARRDHTRAEQAALSATRRSEGDRS